MEIFTNNLMELQWSTYSTLVMGYFEEILYQKAEKELDQKISEHLKHSWKRYLDDCFIFWEESEEDLHEFHSLLNSLNPNIQFTMEFSDCSISFLDLDIMVLKNQSKISTDVYYKTTDTHQYLNFKSCHPTHTKRNIPYNLSRRICTIVSEEKTKDQRLMELKMYLSAQNYPEKLIDSAIEEAKKILRSTRNKRPMGHIAHLNSSSL